MANTIILTILLASSVCMSFTLTNILVNFNFKSGLLIAYADKNDCEDKAFKKYLKKGEKPFEKYLDKADGVPLPSGKGDVDKYLKKLDPLAKNYIDDLEPFADKYIEDLQNCLGN